jgi:hypothetical protein
VINVIDHCRHPSQEESSKSTPILKDSITNEEASDEVIVPDLL